jgi:TonB family protein
VEERIDLVSGTAKTESRFSVATAVSIAVHVALLILFIRAHRAAPEIEKKETPIARYVELIRANPREFVEAPGPEVGTAPLNAPFSDANRRASIPSPTGDQPTRRPGDGRGLYTPPSGGAPPRPPVQAAASGETAAPQEERGAPEAIEGNAVSSRIPAFRSEAALGTVNWRSAIREMGKVASIGDPGSLDLGGAQGGGGEKGFADAGPLSFETQWYEWGDYAASMISKIRVNWYNVMPDIIRTGLPGVATIRFTIQRDGRITDIVMISGSGVPPYDFAAKKALELSSPLNPLPKDFPNPSERVTAMFYYNRPVPAGR